MSFPDPITYHAVDNSTTTLPEIGNGTPTSTLYRGNPNAETEVSALIRQTESKTRKRSEFRLTFQLIPQTAGAVAGEPLAVYLVVDRGKAPGGWKNENIRQAVVALKNTLGDDYIGRLINGEL